MTGFPERHYRQDVTIWRDQGKDQWGNITWGSPETVKGRWSERLDLFTDVSGQQKVSRAVALLPVDVAEGDMLALGDHDDAAPVSAARRVQEFRKTPDVSVKRYVRRALL